MAEGPSTSERLASAYRRLAASAQALNTASEELAKPISQLEEALQKLNIGLDTWETIAGGHDDHGGHWRRELGYVSCADGLWHLAIQKREGHPSWAADEIENWKFNDAPRSLRIEALDKLPDLLEQIIKNSEKTAKKLKQKTVEAQELASVLTQAADEVRIQKELARLEKKERR